MSDVNSTDNSKADYEASISKLGSSLAKTSAGIHTVREGAAAVGDNNHIHVHNGLPFEAFYEQTEKRIRELNVSGFKDIQAQIESLQNQINEFGLSVENAVNHSKKTLKRVAILIGHGGYGHFSGFDHQRYTTKSLAEIKTLLSDQYDKIFEFNHQDSKTLWKSLKDCLDFQSFANDGLCVIYYIGYVLKKSNEEEMYFATSDTQLSHLSQTTLALNSLMRLFATYNRRQYVCLIDGCYLNVDKNFIGKNHLSILSTEEISSTLDQALTSEIICELMTASGLSDTEQECTNVEKSAFLHAILETLKVKQNEVLSGTVSIQSVFEWTKNYVFSKNIGSLNPIFLSSVALRHNQYQFPFLTFPVFNTASNHKKATYTTVNSQEVLAYFDRRSEIEHIENRIRAADLSTVFICCRETDWPDAIFDRLKLKTSSCVSKRYYIHVPSPMITVQEDHEDFIDSLWCETAKSIEKSWNTNMPMGDSEQLLESCLNHILNLNVEHKKISLIFNFKIEGFTLRKKDFDVFYDFCQQWHDWLEELKQQRMATEHLSTEAMNLSVVLVFTFVRCATPKPLRWLFAFNSYAKDSSQDLSKVMKLRLEHKMKKLLGASLNDENKSVKKKKKSKYKSNTVKFHALEALREGHVDEWIDYLKEYGIIKHNNHQESSLLNCLHSKLQNQWPLKHSELRKHLQGNERFLKALNGES